jgi:Icc protein
LKYAWLSDIHLNFTGPALLRKFLQELHENDADIILISGDIAEADTVCKYLDEMAEIIRKPIYFVLGNHDYYKDSISHVRENVSGLSTNHSFLNWLPKAGVVRLTDSLGLIGHGSWADSRWGNYMMSDMLLTDYFIIKDFNQAMYVPNEDITKDISSQFSLNWFINNESKLRRRKIMMELADEAADYVTLNMPKALDIFKEVIFLTHVPPFKEACLYRGQITDETALPHFSCKAVGDKLHSIMKEYPHRNLTVLCGHMHEGEMVRVAKNILVYSATVKYGAPSVQRIFEAAD